MHIMDDQLCWVTDSGFRTTNLKTNAHAILLFDAFKNIHLRDWTCPNLLNEFFSFCFNFTEINIFVSLIKLLLQSLIHRLVFKGTLIETLLNICFADRSVCNIVELSKHGIVNEIMLILFHEIKDNRDLLFVRQVLLHELFTGFFILNFMNKLAIYLLVKFLDEVINDLSCFKILELHLLDVSKKLSF